MHNETESSELCKEQEHAPPGWDLITNLFVYILSVIYGEARSISMQCMAQGGQE